MAHWENVDIFTGFIGILRGRFRSASWAGTFWALSTRSFPHFGRWLGLLRIRLRWWLRWCRFELIIWWILEGRSGIERLLALQASGVSCPRSCWRWFAANIVATFAFHTFANLLAGTFSHNGTHAHAIINALSIFRASSLSKFCTGQFSSRKCNSLILSYNKYSKPIRCEKINLR